MSEKLFNYDNDMLEDLKITLPGMLINSLRNESEKLDISLNEAIYIYLYKGLLLDKKDLETFNLVNQVEYFKNH